MSQDSTGRTVVIVRHAKAEAQAATDHARPLTERGLADARAAGRWLAQHLGSLDSRPVEALVSTATRARLTWDELSAAVTARTRMMDGLYQAGADEMLQTLTMLDDTVSVVIVVAHNPTAHEVVDRLSDGTTSAHEELRSRGFPTCAIAVLHLDGSWHDLGDGACTLAALHVARG